MTCMPVPSPSHHKSSVLQLPAGTDGRQEHVVVRRHAALKASYIYIKSVKVSGLEPHFCFPTTICNQHLWAQRFKSAFAALPFFIRWAVLSVPLTGAGNVTLRFVCLVLITVRCLQRYAKHAVRVCPKNTQENNGRGEYAEKRWSASVWDMTQIIITES